MNRRRRLCGKAKKDIVHLVENANDMVFRTDRKGYFTFVNVSTIRITGYEEEEIIGKHYFDSNSS